MSFKKSISLMVASTVISTALSAIANAEGLEFGCTPLAVNMGSECLVETGCLGEAQIYFGHLKPDDERNLYFSLAGSILGASGDSADDYEITSKSIGVALCPTTNSGIELVCNKLPVGEDGRMIVQLKAIPVTDRERLQGLFEQLKIDRQKSLENEIIRQLAEERGVDEYINYPTDSLHLAVTIKSKSTGETRTINCYATAEQ